MAKKKAAVEKNKASLKKSRKKAIKSKNVISGDSSAYVVLSDAVGSQNPSPRAPLVVSLRATAQDCQGEAIELSNFEFGTLARSVGPLPIEVKVPGIIMNPGQSSSEILFEIPSWAAGEIGIKQEELIITVTTKKKVRLNRS